MSGRSTSHRLSSGLYVSGPLPQPKERAPLAGPRAVPYTGGDVRKSGELGKMFDIPVLDPSAAPAGASRSRPHSGSLASASPGGSGPPSRRTSGPLSSQLPVTGLITSGPARRSGGQPGTPASGAEQTPAARRKKKGYGVAVTAVEERGYGFGIPAVWYWALAGTLVVGLGAGAFLWVAVGSLALLVGVAALLVLVLVLAVWNWSMRSREVERFLRSYLDTPIDPRNLPIGKYVKITGHVTCGSIPLETSYKNFSRCVYTSAEMFEYRGWSGLPANPNHRRFTWGLRYEERRVADFYVSDPNSGARFLVRAGNGAKVTSFVKPVTVVDINKENKQQNPDFLSWLTDHDLSCDDRIMRLKEGCIQEGNTASVMGILRKHENTIMIDPPTDVVSTGCQWKRCFVPMFVQGLVLMADERPDEVVYHV